MMDPGSTHRDEVDRALIALKFKVTNHQRTVGVAARVPRQRAGMDDKVPDIRVLDVRVQS